MASVVRLLRQQTTRQCGVEDADWILALAIKRYPKFDVDGAGAWLKAALAHPSVCVATDSGSVGVVSLISPSWEPGEILAILNFLVSPESTSSPFVIIRIMKFLASWARRNGASEFRFGNNHNDAGGEVNFAPIARRLGARDITEPYFSLDLNGANNGT